jgi:WD40 repeat protein
VWLAFSDDGKSIISHGPINVGGEPYSEIKVWNYTTGAGKEKFVAHGQGILITNRYLVTRVWPDRTLLKVYDLETEKPVQLKGHTSQVEQACLTADGKYLATAGREGGVKIWRLPDGKEMQTLNVLKTSSRRMSFLNDNHTLAVADSTGITLYNVVDNKTVYRNRDVAASAIAPGGELMSRNGAMRVFNEKTRISTGYPDAIHLFSRKKGDVIATFKVDPDRWHAERMLFSLDGRLLVGGGGDGVVRIWDISKLQP